MLSILRILAMGLVMQCCWATDDDSVLDSSSLSTLALSPKILCSMPYRDFRINIYEHSHNKRDIHHQNKYYYTPIALLDNESADGSFNKVTQQHEMQFRVQMWNDDVERQVAQYVSELIDHPLKSHQVQVIPSNQVSLSSTKPTIDFKLSRDWIDYSGHRELTFTLDCATESDCDRLAETMRFSPEQFGHFRILFQTPSQNLHTKVITVRIENILSGELATRLFQRVSDKDDSVVLLTAEDSERLLRETMTNIFTESFDDMDVILPSSEIQTYNILQSMLLSSVQVIQNAEDNLWNSVFWNDDNYRPDKTSKTLNNMYLKQYKSKQQSIVLAYSRKDNISLLSDVTKAELQDIFQHELKNDSRKMDADTFYESSLKHVEWNGEKFEPKPLPLRRFDLRKLRDRQSFHDRSVRIRYKRALLSLSLNFIRPNAIRPATFVEEWNKIGVYLEKIENRLEEMEKKVPRAVSRVPDSCADLKRSGQIVSGIYLIKVQNSIEAVYCDFTKHDLEIETRIGNVDVKEKLVYFHAFITHMSTPYSDTEKFICNDCSPVNNWYVNLNEGNAMNGTTGIFTAPVSGIYFFTLTGIASHVDKNGVATMEILLLGKYDVVIANAIAEDGFTYYGQKSPLAMQASIQMEAGESVWLSLQRYEWTDPTKTALYFSGWLLQQI